MAQQINLIDLRLMPRTVAFGGQHALYGALAVLALGTVAAVTLQGLSHQTSLATSQLQQQASTLQAAASAPVAHSADAGAELDRMRLLDAGQRRVQAALEAGVAGDREGPADYFKALARQAQSQVWITGFSVADNGNSIELEGRMAQAEQLTDYLRKLKHEPRFNGRSFAQLALNGMDKGSGAPLPYTEFALRSRPATGPGQGQGIATGR